MSTAYRSYTESRRGVTGSDPLRSGREEASVSADSAGSLRDEELSRWRQRLNGLSQEQQSQISRKYYGGKMPWR